MINTINDKLTISLYLDDKYNENSIEVIDLINDINDLKLGIRVDYKTKEDVLNEMRLRDPDLVKILERENPLPATI